MFWTQRRHILSFVRFSQELFNSKCNMFAFNQTTLLKAQKYVFGPPQSPFIHSATDFRNY